MPGRLQDKVALVTGAGCIGPGWGNGRATAVLFAREGAKVLAVDKNGASMKETLDRVAEFGGIIKTHECDVTQSAAVKAMIDACLAAFGRIDVLVNNVGGSAAGAIVNLASTSGLRWTGSPQVGYAASKAGVMQLSRVVAVQYANKGIRVNTVVPGQLHTPMVEARLAGQRAGGDVEKLLQTRVSRIPAGFMGDGRDTAHAALFLASDEARFVTGTEIIVDGGMVARCD
jgi:NAD(P)-dependent dehydrogenase (short-subunit alcohol dehydrogenase family)